jgi:hypothetical protein
MIRRKGQVLTIAKTVEGLKFGIVLVLVTLVLDTSAYVLLLGSGDYFAFLSI